VNLGAVQTPRESGLWPRPSAWQAEYLSRLKSCVLELKLISHDANRPERQVNP
jgi:hypothetical protein